MVWKQCGSKATLNNRAIFVAGVYRTPNSTVDVLELLRSYMDSNLDHGDNVLLLRDFNLPGINWLSSFPGTIEVTNSEQLL